jgi:hypothetical protein
MLKAQGHRYGALPVKKIIQPAAILKYAVGYCAETK